MKICQQINIRIENFTARPTPSRDPSCDLSFSLTGHVCIVIHMLCYTGLYIIHTHKNNTDIHTCIFTEEDMIGTHQQRCGVVASVFRRVHTSALHIYTTVEGNVLYICANVSLPVHQSCRVRLNHGQSQHSRMDWQFREFVSH